MPGTDGTLELYATPQQLSAMGWLREAANAGGTVKLRVEDLARLIATRSFVSYSGRRGRLMATMFPGGQRYGWVDTSAPGAMGALEYAGDEYEWAAALPGFEARDVWHPYGYGVDGDVPLSEVTDFTQEITEYPVVTSPRPSAE